jgi:hypothetical protein
MTDKEFLMLVRQALLLAVDAIERKLELNPRTAELRKKLRENEIESQSGIKISQVEP